VANPQIADLVSVSQDYVIYRPMVIAMTRKGRGSAPAGDFFRFIQSPEGERIFKKWGWMGSKP
jgi:accessory colonization factor AcfC